MYNEKSFTTRLRKSADKWCSENGKSIFWHKIADTGFTNPFDIIGCRSDGKCLAIEVKMCKNKTIWNARSSFFKRHHQIDNLIKIDNLGGKAWVILCHFQYPDTNTAYAITPSVAHGLIVNGSIIISELIEHKLAVELPYMKGQLYDLSPILK